MQCFSSDLAIVIGDFIGSMMAYEAGQMTHEEVVAFYQYLIGRGLVPRVHDSTAESLGY